MSHVVCGMNQKGCPTYFFHLLYICLFPAAQYAARTSRTVGHPVPATGYGFTGFHTRHRLWQKVPIVELHEFIPLLSIRGTETEIYVVHPVTTSFRSAASSTQSCTPDTSTVATTFDWLSIHTCMNPSFSRCRTHSRTLRAPSSPKSTAFTFT